MDDILGMIVVAVIYLVAAVSGKKKKSRQKAARAKGFKAAFDAWQAAAQETHAAMREEAPAGAQPPLADAEACQGRPIHLHDAPQSVMRSAGEGEDPCHAGGVNTAETEAPREAELYGEEPDSDARMQEMLRGVIMSEILTRPCERRAAERNRRRYHG